MPHQPPKEVNMAKTKVLDKIFEVKLTDLNLPEMADKDGICRTYENEILIRKPEFLLMDAPDECKRDRFRETLLHELIHAYCKCSGVHYDDNEDLVDWFAYMIPKIVTSYDDILNQLKEEE